jgi:hypothetical protein
MWNILNRLRSAISYKVENEQPSKPTSPKKRGKDLDEGGEPNKRRRNRMK